MSNFIKIYCTGSVKAPYDWITSVPKGINRLCLINGGNGGYIINNNKIPFKKGCLYLFPAFSNDISTYSSYENDDERLDHSYANFELLPPILSKDIICIDPNENYEYIEVINIFKTLCIKSTIRTRYEFLDEEDQIYLQNTIIYLINKIRKTKNIKFIDDKIINNALIMMHTNINKKISITEIAKKSYLSTDGFIRKFKYYVGETPYSYLKNLRLRTAQNLQTSGMSLKEIAEHCGYSDSSALLHALKK